MSLRKLPEITALERPTKLSFGTPDEVMEAFDPSVISAQESEEGTISIYGQIGIDPRTGADNTERRIAAALRSIGKKDITVNMNSPGGDFFAGLAIYNLFRGHQAKVTMHVLALAGSAASVVAMAGDRIAMADGALLMLHNASALVVGNKFDTDAATEILGKIDSAMAEIYSARAGVEKSIAAAWMDRNRGGGTFFNADAAIEKGLADTKLAPGTVKARAETKVVPRERIAEAALIAAANMTPHEAKALIAELKSGTRDAPENVTRDADETNAALMRLLATLQS